MAYDLAGFYPDQRGDGHRIHTYTSTDVEAVVAASGYFDTLDTILNVGDKIDCYDSTTNINYAIRVDTNSSGTVTTVSLSPGRSEVVTTTNVILGAETGTHFVLNSTTPFVSTLPALKLGLEFWFHNGALQVTGGNHTVISAPAAKIEGGIACPEAAAVVCVAAADSINWIADTAVQGDTAHVWCDGNKWMLDGICFDQAGMTTTT